MVKKRFIRLAGFKKVVLVGIGLALGLTSVEALGSEKNGFDLTVHKVPLGEIISGGPPRDGIPAILNPVLIPAKDATFLQNEDRVLGIAQGKDVRAYPVKILNWHEVVNDTVAEKPVVITYCPLCGTGIGFDGLIEGRTHTFGVSGLLYQSDLLMYDHQTESLWSQIAMEAVTGSMAGQKLRHLFLEHTTWGEWRRTHPETQVLSTKTGFQRDYNRDPYFGYGQRVDLMFPTQNMDSRFHPKDWVIGVEVGGVTKAYAFVELRKGSGIVRDEVNGRPIIVRFNKEARTASVTDPTGQPIPSVMAYWFAWYAFHPNKQVFMAEKSDQD